MSESKELNCVGTFFGHKLYAVASEEEALALYISLVAMLRTKKDYQQPRSSSSSRCES